MAKNTLTHFFDYIPNEFMNISTGYSLGQEWVYTITGDKYIHRTDGEWVKYIVGDIEIDSSIILDNGYGNITSINQGDITLNSLGKSTILDVNRLSFIGTNTWTLKTNETQGSDYLVSFQPPQKLANGTYTLATVDMLSGSGSVGPIGPTGPTGSIGPTGLGLIVGGTTGQLLSKNSNTDYDTIWIDNYTSVLKDQVRADENLTKGQPVYISSANGTNIYVSVASNLTEQKSSQTLGLVDSTVSTNGLCYVITNGILGGLNTSTGNNGDPVWLGPSGSLIYGTASKPVAPAHLVYIGVVSRSHTTQGEILIKCQNGYELDELHDVLLTSKVNNDILTYETSSGLWKNKSITTILGYTPLNSATPSYTGLMTGSLLTLTSSQSLFKNIFTNGTTFTHNTGNANQFYVNSSYTQTNGDGTFTAFQDNSTINQTVSAVGVTRGFYANPILTNFVDYRAFESSQGKILFTDTILAATGSLSGNLMTLNQTWNTTLNPVTLKINVTNSASRYDASPFQVSIGGTPRFSLTKDGFINFGVASTSPGIQSSNGTTTGSSVGGKAIQIAHYLTSEAGYGIWGGAITATRIATTGECGMFKTAETFNPTSGNATYNALSIANTINQIGGTATGITRGIYINPILTLANDYRAIEITAGKIVVPSTITAVGTTGAQTINKISGKVNAAAGTTSLVVTNSLVTTSSIVICQIGTDDVTARITSSVESNGSFTIYYVAPTAETVIKFKVIN